MRPAPVLERDRVVALAPDDHRRHALQQIQAVGGADPLPVHVDHRAQRLQERLARVGVLERPQRACDRLQVYAAGERSLAQAPPAAGQRFEHARLDRQRQQRRDARQRGGAQHRADLTAEAAAGDQHQALDALGELVEELHRHAAAERVPDDARAVDPDRCQQVADARGVRAERVVAARRRGVAVPDQVGRDDRVIACQLHRDGLPVAG